MGTSNSVAELNSKLTKLNIDLREKRLPKTHRGVASLGVRIAKRLAPFQSGKTRGGIYRRSYKNYSRIISARTTSDTGGLNPGVLQRWLNNEISMAYKAWKGDRTKYKYAQVKNATGSRGGYMKRTFSTIRPLLRKKVVRAVRTSLKQTFG